MAVASSSTSVTPLNSAASEANEPDVLRSLDERDRADLQRSGLSEAMILAMGCYSAEAETIRELTGVARVESAGYAIPYEGLVDQTGRPYIRWRLRHPTDKMRYVSGLGDDAQLYLPPAPKSEATDLLVITEGEKKAAKAVQEGLACIGLQGVWSWSDPGCRAVEKAANMPVSSATAPLASILEVARAYKRVLVLGDSDVLGNAQASKGLDLLARSLRLRNIRAEYGHCPPMVSSGENGIEAQKQGLDDWLVADRAQALRSVPALFVASEVNRLGLTDAYHGAAYAASVRHCMAYSQGIWREWDGRVWNRDDCGKRRDRMHPVREQYLSLADTLRSLMGSVTRILQQGMGKEPIELERWRKPLEFAIAELRKAAERLGGLQAIDAAITLAMPTLRVPDDAWDKDPYLLSVQNGVVDLRTSTLIPATPEQRITRVAGTSFDPAALAPTFESFLTQVQPDPVVRVYLQRLAGYCAVGVASEQKLVVFAGGGANGKSTLISILMAALGRYATKSPISLLAEQSPDKPRNDIAALAGARMVSISETPRNLKLDEAVLKNLTGQDVVCARFLHKEFFEFLPCFTPIVDTNHLPQPRDAGEAIWRRLVVVPWPVTIPEAQRNRHLREALQLELPGFLAWVIEGARIYLESGLPTPAVLKKATHELRETCDELGSWLEVATVFEPGSRVQSSVLYQEFRRWNERQGNSYTVSPRIFAQQLCERGCHVRKVQGVMMWTGLRLCEVSEATILSSDDQMVSQARTGAVQTEAARFRATHTVLPGGSVQI